MKTIMRFTKCSTLLCILSSNHKGSLRFLKVSQKLIWLVVNSKIYCVMTVWAVLVPDLLLVLHKLRRSCVTRQAFGSPPQHGYAKYMQRVARIYRYLKVCWIPKQRTLSADEGNAGIFQPELPAASLPPHHSLNTEAVAQADSGEFEFLPEGIQPLFSKNHNLG